MKIVLNKCYGGFSVSRYVMEELGLKSGHLSNEDFNIKSDNYYQYRTHPGLIKAIEKIGEKNSSGTYADLKIVEIPDDIEFELDEYDGIEFVYEKGRRW